MAAQRKLVLAVDGSEHSERAFQFYLENIHKEGNEVHLTIAMEYPYVPSQPYVRKEILEDIFGEATKNAQKIAEKYSGILTEKQIPYKVHLEFSHPGEYICKVAKDQHAAMVVMGTRGMGSIRRTILGSVSDYVVHHVHCPVLIVRH